jgi:flagellar motor switch protein FliG
METDAYRRAAIVVASLERQSADDILERLPETQARAIRDELVLLDELIPSERDDAIREFLETRPSDHVSVDAEIPRELESLNPASQLTAGPLVGNSSLDDLLAQDDESIALAVMHERTSVVAALLAAVPGKRAAAVLRRLPTDLQSRVVTVLNLGVASNPVAVDIIADQICDKQAELIADQRLGMHHRDALQAIFDELTPEERIEMLCDLEKENPVLAQRLTPKEMLGATTAIANP